MGSQQQNTITSSIHKECDQLLLTNKWETLESNQIKYIELRQKYIYKYNAHQLASPGSPAPPRTCCSPTRPLPPAPPWSTTPWLITLDMIFSTVAWFYKTPQHIEINIWMSHTNHLLVFRMSNKITQCELEHNTIAIALGLLGLENNIKKKHLA